MTVSPYATVTSISENSSSSKIKTISLLGVISACKDANGTEGACLLLLLLFTLSYLRKKHTEVTSLNIGSMLAEQDKIKLWANNRDEIMFAIFYVLRCKVNNVFMKRQVILFNVWQDENAFFVDNERVIAILIPINPLNCHKNIVNQKGL